MAINKQPFVSVIINTFNYGHFIEQAIDSVLAQTLNKDDMEIIVVDDGSTDDTQSRLQQYNGLITCLRKENGGQASAFNSGLKHARGKIIAMLDSDDYWTPDKLEIVTDYFRKNDAIDIFYHNLQIVDTCGAKVRPYYTTIPPSSVPEKTDMAGFLNGVLKDFPPTSGMIFRKSCLKKIMPIPEHYYICADTYLHYFSYLNARKILFVPDMYGYYRIHDKNNFCNEDKGNKFRHLIRIYPLLVDDLSFYGKSLKLDTSAIIRTVEFLIEYWKLELKISTLPTSKKILYLWYFPEKFRLFIYRIIKGNRVRRLIKFSKQSFLKMLLKNISMKMDS